MSLRKKILVVDDDIDVIGTVKAVLGKDYDIITAHDKVEGLEKARLEKPNLVILDVMMTTRFEGFEMAKEIVEDPELRHIPVFMQTSNDVLTTTKDSVQEMVHEYRMMPGYSELDVLLLKNIATGETGVDYMNENGESIWFPVKGFLRKPVDFEVLSREVSQALQFH